MHALAEAHFSGFSGWNESQPRSALHSTVNDWNSCEVKGALKLSMGCLFVLNKKRVWQLQHVIFTGSCYCRCNDTVQERLILLSKDHCPVASIMLSKRVS